MKNTKSLLLVVFALFTLSLSAHAASSASRSLECTPKQKGQNLKSVVISPESDGTYTSTITYRSEETPTITTTFNYNRSEKFNTLGTHHAYYNYKLVLSNLDGAYSLITYLSCAQDPYHISGCEGGAEYIVDSQVALSCKSKRTRNRK